MLRRTKHLGAAVAVVFLWAAGPVPAARDFALQQITPDVYVHERRVAETDAINQGGIANRGFVIGERRRWGSTLAVRLLSGDGF